MKKSSLFLIGFLYLSLMAFTQDNSDASEPTKNEIGVNINQLIENVFTINTITNNFIDPTRYQLTYKRKFQNFYLRTAIAVSNYSETTPDWYYDFDRERSKTELFYRLGLEKQVHIHNKWTPYYGLDLIYEFEGFKTFGYNSNGSWAKSTDSKTNGFGIAPILGMNFNIVPNVSLQIEGSLSVRYLKEKNTSDYDLIEGEDLTERPLNGLFEYETFKLNTHVPLYINIVMRF